MSQSEFNKFQLAEYEFIAQAHFETIKQVTNFFRYYLIILSAPAVIFLLFDHKIDMIEKFINSPIIYKNTSFILASFLLVISGVGFLLCIYLINMRQDAILYARTVNGIRKYFYEQKTFTKLEFENYVRIMTKKITQPNYFEKHIFLPVVLTFSIINTSYLYFSFYFYPKNILSKIPSIYGASYNVYIPLIFLFLHIFTYMYLSYYRNNYYMRSHKIGIDIDGVLNKHREHFCSLLFDNFNNSRLKPEEITTIPVHNIDGKYISETDEHLVFNNIKYWTEMPPIQNNFRDLKKIKKELGYSIYIFSRRPWPQWELLNKENDRKIEIRNLKEAWPKIYFKRRSLRSITLEWLKRNGIPVSRFRLIIESGSLDVSDFTFHIFKRKLLLHRNRFQIARKKNFRFFVDDDPKIVNKMSNYCDYVFLIEQPYNRNGNYPSNVIIVKDWKAIYENIKVLS